MSAKLDDSPAEDTERALAAIWSDLLKVESVGPDDNFFELGGQSPLAARLLTKVSERFNVWLPFIAIFQYPTIRQMARALEGESFEGGAAMCPGKCGS